MGNRKGCHTCPIALAVLRALGRKRGDRTVMVNRREIGLRRWNAREGAGPWKWIEIPTEASVFISRFDLAERRRSAFEPFEFNLDIPEEVLA